MTTETGPQGLSLRLAMPPRMTGLATGILASALGISREEAADRLQTGMVADGLSVEAARSLRALLSAAGIAVRTETTPARVNLSIQLAVWADGTRAARRLARALDGDADDVGDRLSRPGGMIFTDLDRDAADRLRGVTGRVRGTVVTLSDPATALYDLYLTRPLSDDESARLDDAMQLAGATGDALTGAVAAGLPKALCGVLTGRLAGLDLLAMDQAFQRFDLVLTGTNGWVTRDLADFLTARTHQPRARFEALSPEATMTLDLGLTGALARRFCADYAAIGLFVRPVLSGRAGSR